MSTSLVTTFAGADHLSYSSGSTNGDGANAKFYAPRGVAISPDGTYALIADDFNNLIRRIIISTAYVTTLAGVAGTTGSTNGVGTNAKFNGPRRVTISPDGTFALIADTANHLIRQIVLSTASVTTLAGVAGTTGSTNGVGTNAKFNSPVGVCVSPDGTYALIGDGSNYRVRQLIISTASVTTLVGSGDSIGSTNGVGTNAKLAPYGIDISPDGTYALFADYGNHRIRQIVISTANVTTLAGSVYGFTDGVGTMSNSRTHTM